ncbi:hypothetical protein ACCO45_012659 [Purpureocillium lilacinum]|uniref:Uncharacterized protein n=1 Tax=Purpureocillium lilacinum TaxID=33203 RepID=A0ACC4D916_PURLI
MPVAHNNGVDDYRNVIDDLTVQIHQLKAELRRYKEKGPKTLRTEEVFEIKIHDIPKRKKRELEDILREFAAGLGGPFQSSPSQKNSSKHTKGSHTCSGSCSNSHLRLSASGGNAPITDPGYASMSTGVVSSGNTPGRTPIGSRIKVSEQILTDYRCDTPECLLPRQVSATDKERKKLVVRRLEQLFTGTGKTTSSHAGHAGAASSTGNGALATALANGTSQKGQQTQTFTLTATESQREARIMPLEQQDVEREGQSWHNEFTPNSDGGHDETNGSRHPEQRPTQPTDLDPDRVQLHLLSVTPNFVRYAVMEFSTKLQVSQDGRKIRWSGGSKGIKLSHVDSEEYSERNSVTEDASNSGSAGQRKRQKSGSSAVVGTNRGSLRTDSYHYTPLFAHQEPLDAQTQPAADGRYSSLRLLGDDEVDQVQWEGIACAASKSRKRYHDGVIIYYKGAPFYADLLGDRGSPMEAGVMERLRTGKQGLNESLATFLPKVERELADQCRRQSTALPPQRRSDPDAPAAASSGI